MPLAVQGTVSKVVSIQQTFEEWRASARALLHEHVPPGRVAWQDVGGAQPDLLAGLGASVAAHGDALASSGLTVPKTFLALAESVACHADGSRWDALYRVLFRLTHGEPSLLEVATDPDVHRVQQMHRAVRRETHKMHAFVRFRAVDDGQGRCSYAAWFEPAHDVVARASGLFVRRFAAMRWSILTPRRCAHWDGDAIRFTPGVSREAAPSEDTLEELWRTYYAHIFNPARVSTATMRAEMPMRYWANLPEARLIAPLTREAPGRVARMLAQVAEAPALLPEELHADERTARTASIVLPSLDVPGPWDPAHDAGASVARARGNVAWEERTRDGAAPRMPVLHGVPFRIGTASWTDPTLLQRGVFYPDGVRTPEARLHYYASRFPVVEVDATYYVPPTRSMAAAWAARTPADFVMDVKAFALMTGHAADTRRLPDWLRRMVPRSLLGSPRLPASALGHDVLDEVWARFLGALQPLRDAGKLGPVLLQYPRTFVPSRESADALRVARERLGSAPAAVEFRNPAWVTGRVAARTIALLEQLQLTYVIVDAPPGTSSSMPPVAPITTPGFSMVRLHGRRSEAWEARHRVVSERYRYLYDASELAEWAERLDDLARRMAAQGPAMPDMAHARQGVHVVHNNCHANYGTTNADEITALLIGFDEERRRA